MSSKALLACIVIACAGCPRGSGGECDFDRECEPDICARDHMCTAASNVRAVTVTWTVNGGDANIMTCSPQPEFSLTFYGDDFDDELGFTPVPCATGQFFIDLLPRRFHTVELGVIGRIPINADGTASGDFRL